MVCARRLHSSPSPTRMDIFILCKEETIMCVPSVCATWTFSWSKDDGDEEQETDKIIIHFISGLRSFIYSTAAIVRQSGEDGAEERDEGSENHQPVNNKMQQGLLFKWASSYRTSNRSATTTTAKPSRRALFQTPRR